MSNPILTKKYHFCASHKYGNDHWSDEKNYEVFGKDYNNHGHNYILELSMTGPVNPDTGWLVDLQHVNNIVKSKKEINNDSSSSSSSSSNNNNNNTASLAFLSSVNETKSINNTIVKKKTYGKRTNSTRRQTIMLNPNNH